MYRTGHSRHWKHMNPLPFEYEPSKALDIAESIDYVIGSIVMKSIIRRATGNISAVAMDAGEKLEEKVSPFHEFIQIIDGRAEIIIDDHSTLLNAGHSIIVPAHSRHAINANSRFKMIVTVIKSGYENVS